MMKTIGAKIRELIRKKGYRTIKEFYEALTAVFEKNAINRSTLTRILKGRVEVRERTLNQIALILGVRTSSLREGTDAEVLTALQPERVFTYNERATLRILGQGLPFLASQLMLKKNGRTSEERDSSGEGEAEAEAVKWVYVLVGKIAVIVHAPDGVIKRNLHKSQAWSFDARWPHYFENASKNTSLALIVHYPVTNSGLLAN